MKLYIRGSQKCGKCNEYCWAGEEIIIQSFFPYNMYHCKCLSARETQRKLYAQPTEIIYHKLDDFSELATSDTSLFD